MACFLARLQIINQSHCSLLFPSITSGKIFVNVLPVQNPQEYNLIMPNNYPDPVIGVAYPIEVFKSGQFLQIANILNVLQVWDLLEGNIQNS